MADAGEGPRAKVTGVRRGAHQACFCVGDALFAIFGETNPRLGGMGGSARAAKHRFEINSGGWDWMGIRSEGDEFVGHIPILDR